MARSDRVSFLSNRSMVAVRARINGAVEAALLVDSGAGRMIISRTAATQAGIDLGRPLRQESLAGVGGTVRVPVVRLGQVQVGASVVGSLAASVYDLPAFLAVDGVLALNFLSRFRVTLEFDSRTLILRTPPSRR
jgi:predicted aspartyl protease